MHSAVLDLRYAFRRLRKSPAFAFTDALGAMERQSGHGGPGGAVFCAAGCCGIVDAHPAQKIGDT